MFKLSTACLKQAAKNFIFSSHRVYTTQNVPKTIVKLSPSVSQIDFYNKSFDTQESKIVVLKVGGAVLTEQLPSLTNTIADLKKAGVFPIIVHGAGPQLNKNLKNASIEPEYEEGMRVTDEKTLAIAVKTFTEENQKLKNSLESSGLNVESFVGSNLLTGKCIDFSTWKFVGDVETIDKSKLLALKEEGKIPVIASVAQNMENENELLNINADLVAVSLAKVLDPHMVVFINDVGGIKNGSGKIIPKIDLTTEYDEYMHEKNKSWVKYGTKLKLKQFHKLSSDYKVKCPVWLTDANKAGRLLINDLEGPDSTIVYSSSSAPSSLSASPLVAAMKKKSVAVIGARGYVGAELIKMLDDHSGLSIECVSSRAFKGLPLQSQLPNIKTAINYTELSVDEITDKHDFDCWVLALPNGLAEKYVQKIVSSQKVQPVIIDLSADYRFNSSWQYGSPERFREQLRKAKLISNPGCYATGAQLSVLPFANNLAYAPSVFGVSGYSGAGTSPSPKNDPKVLKDNLIPYALTNHIHEREVSLQVNHPIHFMPHVASFFRGISLTTNMELKEGVSQEQAFEIYSECYLGEPLIKVQQDAPLVVDNAFKHHVAIGGFTVSPTDPKRLTVVATLDNLLKGAATQALQNMNLALGFPELMGIINVQKDVQPNKAEDVGNI